MQTHTKKSIIPYGRPKLTVVRDIEKSRPKSEEVVNEKEKEIKKLLMPEQGSGYIKTRKHDCL